MTSQPPGPPTPPPPAATPPGGPGVAAFFDRIRAYGAVRPDDGRWFAGVAAALARRWGIDPLLVRGGFVVLALFGGIGLFLYGLGWLFLPHPDGRIHAQEVLSGRVTAGFVGGVLCVLADLGGSGWDRGGWYVGPRPFGGGLVFVGLIIVAVWWFGGGRHRRGPVGWGHGGPGHGGWGHGPGGHGPGGYGPGDGGDWRGQGGPGSSPTPEPGPAPAEPSRLDAGGPATDPSTGPAPSTGEVPPYGTPPGAATSSFAAGYPLTAYDPGTTTTAAPAWAPQPVPVPSPRPNRRDLARPSHALVSVVLGIALLGGAATALIARATGADHVGVLASAVALGIVALGVVVAGVVGRRAGGLAPIGIVLAAVVVAGTASTDSVSWAGNRTWTPGALQTRTTAYDLALGNGRLDLRQLAAPGATATTPDELDVRVGFGNLTVVVPAGVPVRIVATNGVGDVDNAAGLAAATGSPAPSAAPGTGGGPTQRDAHADIDVQTAPDPVVVVRANVGVGNLTIENG